MIICNLLQIIIIKGWEPFMGMTSLSVCLSVRLLRSLYRVNVFERGFPQSTQEVSNKFKFVPLDGPFRLHGHRSEYF
jgi:hypothetical protein